MLKIRNFLVYSIILVVIIGCVFPSNSLNKKGTNTTIANANWDVKKLDEAFLMAKKHGSSTLIVITDGKYVQSLGNTRKVHRVHSIRKALLSALVGQQVGFGPKKLNLTATLEDLGIDDTPNPLTPLQKQATVLHLIKSISGINHAAVGEIPIMIKNKKKILGTRPNQPGTV